MVQKFAVLDIETTGLNYMEKEITQIAIVLLNEEFEEESTFDTYVQIEAQSIPEYITELTGIKKEDTVNGMSKEELKGVLKYLLDGRIIIAQNAAFDLSFIEDLMQESYDFMDLQAMSLVYHPNEKANLDEQAKRYGLAFKHHDALEDAKVTTELLEIYMEKERTPFAEMPKGLMSRFLNYLIVRQNRPMLKIPNKAEVIDVFAEGGAVYSVLQSAR